MSTCAAIVTAQKQALSAEAELEVRRLEAQWKTLEYVVGLLQPMIKDFNAQGYYPAVVDTSKKKGSEIGYSNWIQAGTSLGFYGAASGPLQLQARYEDYANKERVCYVELVLPLVDHGHAASQLRVSFLQVDNHFVFKNLVRRHNSGAPEYRLPHDAFVAALKDMAPFIGTENPWKKNKA